MLPASTGRIAAARMGLHIARRALVGSGTATAVLASLSSSPPAPSAVSASAAAVRRRQLSSSSSSTIQRIDQTTLPTMSQVVVHNGIAYVSGQIDTDGGTDVVTQTQNVLGKIDDLLQQAGTDKSKLLTASVWLKDIERDFAAMNGVWTQWIDPEHKPVRATTEANLAFPHLLVEVQVSAVVD